MKFTEFIYHVHNNGHHWGEVQDFCDDAYNDPQWETITSIKTMKERINLNGWRHNDSNVGEAAMNTWYAYKGLKRTSER